MLLNWNDSQFGQYGPWSQNFDNTLNVDSSGAPLNNVTQNAVPVRQSSAGQYANPTIQNNPNPSFSTAYQGGDQVPTIQSQMGGDGGPDFPRLQGAFSMPQYGSMDKVTHYQSAFDRFPALTQQLQDNSSHNGSGAMGMLRMLSYGMTPMAQRQQNDVMDLKRKQAQAAMLSDLAGASAADQQGLERNTASYGNISKAYQSERMAPYEQRTEYNKGSHEYQLGRQASTAAGQNIAQTQTENAMREPKIYSEKQLGYDREQSGLHSAAQTQTENDLRTGKIAIQGSEQKIKGAEADNATPYYQNRATVEANKAKNTATQKPQPVPKEVQSDFAKIDSLITYGTTPNGKETLDTVNILDPKGNPIVVNKTKSGRLYGQNPDEEATIKATREEKIKFLKQKRAALLLAYPQLVGGQTQDQSEQVPASQGDSDFMKETSKKSDWRKYAK